MWNPTQKFRQSSIFFEKPGILPENLKIFTKSNYPTVHCFCWNFVHVSYLPMSIKGLRDLFLFCLNLELFAKIKQTGFLHTRIYTFINNSRFKQNKKSPENVCKISAKNIKLYGSRSSSKCSVFQTKNLVSWKL